MARADGVTPLMMVCQQGHVNIVKELLQHPHIDLNKTNHLGQDALYMAREYKQKDIAKLLLDAGATDKVKIMLIKPFMNNHGGCSWWHWFTISKLVFLYSFFKI